MRAERDRKQEPRPNGFGRAGKKQVNPNNPNLNPIKNFVKTRKNSRPGGVFVRTNETPPFAKYDAGL